MENAISAAQMAHDEYQEYLRDLQDSFQDMGNLQTVYKYLFARAAQQYANDKRDQCDRRTTEGADLYSRYDMWAEMTIVHMHDNYNAYIFFANQADTWAQSTDPRYVEAARLFEQAKWWGSQLDTYVSYGSRPSAYLRNPAPAAAAFGGIEFRCAAEEISVYAPTGDATGDGPRSYADQSADGRVKVYHPSAPASGARGM